MNNHEPFLNSLMTKIKTIALTFALLDFVAFILANGPYGTYSHLFFLYGACLNAAIFLLLRNKEGYIATLIKNFACKSALLFSIIIVTIMCSFTVIIHAWPITLLIAVIFYGWLRYKLERIIKR